MQDDRLSGRARYTSPLPALFWQPPSLPMPPMVARAAELCNVRGSLGSAIAAHRGDCGAR